MRRFFKDSNGVSAIEFALISPLLMSLLLGGIELQRFMRLERKLSIAATSVAQTVAQRQYDDVSGYALDLDMIIQIIPELYAQYQDAWWRHLGHQITNVVFTKTEATCVTACAYTANVAQRFPSHAHIVRVPFGDMLRNCGPLTYAPAGSTPSGQTVLVPFGPGSLILVDLRLRYEPIIGSTWLPATWITRQGYAAPRFATPSYPLRGLYVMTCPGY